MEQKSGIGSILKCLRKENGLTQLQVAETLNVDRSTYTYYENNKTQPNISTLKKLASMFNTSVDTIIGYKVPMISSSATLGEPRVEYTTRPRTLLLTDEEKQVLLNYRLLSDQGKSEVNQFLKEAVQKYELD